MKTTLPSILLALVILFTSCDGYLIYSDECWANVDCGPGLACNYGYCQEDWDYCYYYECSSGYDYYYYDDYGYSYIYYEDDGCPYGTYEYYGSCYTEDSSYFDYGQSKQDDGYYYEEEEYEYEYEYDESDECIDMYGSGWFTCPDDSEYCCSYD